jgi:hypothetical protein
VRLTKIALRSLTVKRIEAEFQARASTSSPA